MFFKDNIGMIIGLVIFFLVLACVVVGSVIYRRRMKTKSENDDDDVSDGQPGSNAAKDAEEC